MTAIEPLKKIYQILFDHFGPQGWWPGETELEIIIGAILTQNTSWKNVEKAIKNLKEKNLLEIKKLSRIRKDTLAQLIRPAGYFNIKSERIKEIVKFLVKRYNGNLSALKRKEGDVLRRELLSVKGIGKETADSILLYALKKPFFVVDAYTKRILSRHNLITKDATYDEIQNFFHKNLPREEKVYNEFHALLVRLGKTYCRKKPNCSNCPLFQQLDNFLTNPF
uniref:Endonuclease III domain-containing protein n=1 Tax=candidate division WOR-3 bacterium TaxID=2052148 RepID=A0A7C3UU50_UNCW3